MSEQNYKIRHRVNFSVSVKGVITPDVTAELIDGNKEAAVKEAAELLELALREAKSRSGSVFQFQS